MAPRNSPQRQPEPTDDELEALTAPAETPPVNDPPKAKRTKTRTVWDDVRDFDNADTALAERIEKQKAKLQALIAERQKLQDETPDDIKAMVIARREAQAK